MRKGFTVILILMIVLFNTYTIPFAESDLKSADPQTEQSANNKSNRKKSAESAPESSGDDTNNSDNDKSDKKSTGDNGQKNEDSENNASDTPEVQSEAAYLVHSSTGTVLYEKNSNSRMYPASTTKIMTAYIALERLELTAQITASKAAVSIASDSSKMGLLEGETLTVEDLLYALMIQSANDAANVLAEAVSGSIGEFVNLMNQTAQELGMTNTHFVNPHGYHDDNHYTTAHDMSIIAQKAMENPTFAKIVSTKSIKIQPTNKYNKVREFSTRNSLINIRSSLKLQYQYANGIKTGYTDKAGQCLVGSASRNEMDLISVVFHAPDDVPERAFIDTKNLFQYAYSKYRIKTVLTADELASTCNVKWASGKPHLILKSNRDIKPLLPRENYNPELLTSKINIYNDVVAPVKEGDELGEIKYYYDKQEVITAKLYASRSVSRSYVKQFLSYILNIWFLLILGIVVVIIILRRIKENRRIAKLRRIRKQHR